MFRFVNENTIETIQTLTHAHGIERFIKKRKHLNNVYVYIYIYIILDALNQYKHEWVKHVKHIADKYHNTVHSTIELKPNEAVKPSNHLWISWHLQNAAKHIRQYEEIKQVKWLE